MRSTDDALRSKLNALERAYDRRLQTAREFQRAWGDEEAARTKKAAEDAVDDLERELGALVLSWKLHKELTVSSVVAGAGRG